jgi:hypothetical protein
LKYTPFLRKRDQISHPWKHQQRKTYFKWKP